MQLLLFSMLLIPLADFSPVDIVEYFVDGVLRL